MYQLGFCCAPHFTHFCDHEYWSIFTYVHVTKNLRAIYQRSFSRNGSSLNKLILFWVLIFMLTIAQDYIFANLRDTGFYFSECALFNSYWLLFIPIIIGTSYILPKTRILERSLVIKLFCAILLSAVLTSIHLLLFTALVTFTSNLIYTTPHYFSNVLTASISNDLYITALFYTVLPYILDYLKRESSNPAKANASDNLNYLTIKQNGGSQIRVDLGDILSITANKPYTTITTLEKDYLSNFGLAELEKLLDPEVFMRIHKSTIINATFIKEIHSLKNGDYSIALTNEQNLRMSRHYRSRWAHLI